MLKNILLSLVISSACAAYSMPAQADAALIGSAIEVSKLEKAEKEAQAAKDNAERLRGEYLQDEIDNRLKVIEDAADSQDPALLKIVSEANQDLTKYRKEQKERADIALSIQQAEINQYQNKMANKAAFNAAVDKGFGELGWLVLMVITIFILTIVGGVMTQNYLKKGED